MSSSCSSHLSSGRAPHSLLVIRQPPVLAGRHGLTDPYDLSSLHLALRSDASSTPPLPQSSSLLRSFRSERPSSLSPSPLSSCCPSPSSSPLSAPSSPADTSQGRSKHATDSLSDGAQRSADSLTTAPSPLLHYGSDNNSTESADYAASRLHLLLSSLSSSPCCTPLSASSTVTSTPSSSTSSFSSPSSSLFSPSAASSSPHFSALYSPTPSPSPSSLSLCSSSASSSSAASPAECVPPSHPLLGSQSPAVSAGASHRPLRIRRKRHWAASEQSREEQPSLCHSQPQPPRPTVCDDMGPPHSPCLSACGESPLPSVSFSCHRVMPPRPPRITLRTLRIRAPNAGSALAARARHIPSSEQRTDSDEADEASGAEEVEDGAAVDVSGKRRRKWLFSPPSLSCHSPLVADSPPHSSHYYSIVAAVSHSLPSVGAAAGVSPLHRLRRLDPIVSSMHASTSASHLSSTATLPVHASHSDEPSGEEPVAADQCAADSYPVAAISRQRQGVLDRLKALT